MITYIGLILKTKRFQVGSTIDFDRRYKQHLRGVMNPEFNLSLQSNPEGVYWFVSEDDTSEGREEEQYYLDFYTGSRWCTNINPDAVNPPYQGGKKWWVNGKEVKRSLECPGEGWKEGVSERMVSSIIEHSNNRMKVLDKDGKSSKAVEMAHKSHSNRSEDGKSIRAQAQGENWKYKLSELWEDPDHPELGRTTSSALARKQKARGLPHGKSNRVKVNPEGK